MQTSQRFGFPPLTLTFFRTSFTDHHSVMVSIMFYCLFYSWWMIQFDYSNRFQIGLKSPPEGGGHLLMAVCLYSLNISNHGIVNCNLWGSLWNFHATPSTQCETATRASWSAFDGPGKSQHLTMMDLRSGDLQQLVKVKTHIRVSPQKVYKLLSPMLSSCCIWTTHIFWGRFFCISLSLSFSPYKRNRSGDIALILACFSPTASRVGRVRRDHAPCKTEPVQLEDVCTTKAARQANL